MTLDGKKTYITAVVVALASFAMAMGWLSQEQYQVVLGLLGSLGLAALRSGVAKTTMDKAREGEPDEAATLPGGAQPATGYRVGANS
jgi:hypothetical protein